MKESTSSQNFFLSPNNLSEAELSKVAKGLRTIVRRLGKAQINFRFDFFSAKKEFLFRFDFFSAKKEFLFRFTSLVPQKKGKKE